MSGLSCAQKLHKLGREYLIIEEAKHVGGRVHSVYEQGYILDRGFQVYNTAYKHGETILDYQDLDLCHFEPGAKIYHNSNFEIIHDPLKDISKIYQTLISNTSTLLDKLKIVKMIMQLYNYNLSKDFQKDCSTLDFLKDYGFSDKFINTFFKPFFGGVFLEKELNTTSKFFKFVFSNFRTGSACVPRLGMQKIPNQIYEKLEIDSVKLNTKVKTIENNTLFTDKGVKYKAKNIIFTSNSQNIINTNPLKYNSVLCFYFVSHIEVEHSKYIYLFPDEEYINNIAILNSVSEKYAPDQTNLFSITILNHDESEIKLIKMIQNRLSVFFGGKVNDYQYLKQFKILDGTLKQPKGHLFYSPNKEKKYIIAGEQMTNASIDGAIESGIIAAKKVLN